MVDLFNSFPLKKSCKSCCSFGIRDEPSIRTISRISDLFFLALRKTFSIVSSIVQNKSALSSSNRLRAIVEQKLISSYNTSNDDSKLR